MDIWFIFVLFLWTNIQIFIVKLTTVFDCCTFQEEGLLIFDISRFTLHFIFPFSKNTIKCDDNRADGFLFLLIPKATNFNTSSKMCHALKTNLQNFKFVTFLERAFLSPGKFVTGNSLMRDTFQEIAYNETSI